MSSPVNARLGPRKASGLVCVAVAGVLCLTRGVSPMHAQQDLGVQPTLTMKEGDLDIVQVRAPNVYMIAGAGGNILVNVGWMGVVLVDTGSKGTSDKVLAAIKRIAPDKRIRFIIDTGADPDHVGGNEDLAQHGQTLMLYQKSDDDGNGGFGGSDLETNKGAAGVMAHENVLKRMSGRTNSYPVFAWPTEAFTGARTRSLYLNNDAVQMSYQPAAHSDSDTFVYWRRADVVATGDIIDLRHFPVLDTDHGGTINGEIAALTRLIDMTTPPAPLTWHEDRSLVVPGHGRIMDQGDVVEYRDMLTIIRDVVQDLTKKGMSLEQIKAKNPTEGYNKQYGSDAALTDAFVTAVYKTMNAKP